VIPLSHGWRQGLMLIGFAGEADARRNSVQAAPPDAQLWCLLAS